MEDLYVIGTGMTPFGKFPSLSVRDLTRDAVSAALSDAGCAIVDIEVACFANAAQGGIEGQYMIPGQIALRAMGFEKLPIVNIENACASASSAFHLACMHLKAGEADVALAIGVDKMNTPEKQKAFDVLAGAQDVHNEDTTLRNLALLAQDADDAGDGEGLARSVFMDVYASLAKQHMRRFRSTQRMFAAIASKNHAHSVHNPLAQYRKAYSIEEVLGARPIAWPLTLPMCAPVSDGAAAAIVCTGKALHRFQRARAVRVHATVLASGSNRGAEELEQHITRRAANLAYERAGLGPQDMSVAEVHDATAVGEPDPDGEPGILRGGRGRRIGRARGYFDRWADSGESVRRARVQGASDRRDGVGADSRVGDAVARGSASEAGGEGAVWDCGERRGFPRVRGSGCVRDDTRKGVDGLFAE